MDVQGRLQLLEELLQSLPRGILPPEELLTGAAAMQDWEGERSPGGRGRKS